MEKSVHASISEVCSSWLFIHDYVLDCLTQPQHNKLSDGIFLKYLFLSDLSNPLLNLLHIVAREHRIQPYLHQVDVKALAIQIVFDLMDFS